MQQRKMILAFVVVVIAAFSTISSGQIPRYESPPLLTVGTTYVKIYQDTDALFLPGHTCVYSAKLLAGVRYKITVSVPSGTDFDLRVYDGNGNLVASSLKGRGTDESAYVTPRWTGRFRIKVTDHSGSGLFTLKVWKRML